MKEYRIVNSQAIAEELKKLRQAALRRGLAGMFLAAAKQIIRRLQTDPLEFGEPRYRLANLGLERRVAAVRPLLVQYVVDQKRHVVYVVGFSLLAE